MMLFMSYFYTGAELPWRVSLFYIANSSTSVIAALLGSALLSIKTDSVPQGWRFMFLIEGAITLVIGIASYFMMPASAVETRKWYRKNGWYTERQEEILVNKVLRDDPNKGDMNNRQPVSLKELIKAFFDYDLVPIYLVRLLTDLSSTPVSAYMALILRHLGFSPIVTNLLTIPQNVLSIITLMTISWFSKRINDRTLAFSILPIWTVSCLIVLRFWSKAQVDIWGTYALLIILLGAPANGPLSITRSSSNSNSVRNRAVSSAVVNMFAMIIGSNIYRDDDKPLYKRGNVDLIGIAFGSLSMIFIARFYYIWRNKSNKKKECIGI